MIAALRFIHVMGCDEKRHPLGGEPKEQVPELAPGDRIDPRGGFIEKQHGGLVHERTGHGKSLPPAAGKQPGALVDVRFQMGDRDHFVATLSQLATAQAIEFPGKDQILVSRQLIIERKLLRHVTDHVLDRFRVAHDIMAADACGAVAGFENSAKHPNDGRFPRAVRAEKPKDRTFGDRKSDMIDGGEIAELLRQPFTLDHCISHNTLPLPLRLLTGTGRASSNRED